MSLSQISRHCADQLIVFSCITWTVLSPEYPKPKKNWGYSVVLLSFDFLLISIYPNYCRWLSRWLHLKSFLPCGAQPFFQVFQVAIFLLWFWGFCDCWIGCSTFSRPRLIFILTASVDSPVSFTICFAASNTLLACPTSIFSFASLAQVMVKPTAARSAASTIYENSFRLSHPIMILATASPPFTKTSRTFPDIF